MKASIQVAIVIAVLAVIVLLIHQQIEMRRAMSHTSEVETKKILYPRDQTRDYNAGQIGMTSGIGKFW